MIEEKSKGLTMIFDVKASKFVPKFVKVADFSPQDFFPGIIIIVGIMRMILLWGVLCLLFLLLLLVCKERGKERRREKKKEKKKERERKRREKEIVLFFCWGR